MKDDLRFMRLWDIYSPLLTATQREITDLYFNYDLSLGEIAEQKGVSRQSVSDCLKKCRKQLEEYEKKLAFCKALDDLSHEYSAYRTQVERFISREQAKTPILGELKSLLDGVDEQFGVEKMQLGEDGEVVGQAFRSEEE